MAQQTLNFLSSVFGVISFICWILVLVRMFQYGRTAPAIASIVLILCAIGPLVALVYGWMNVNELKIRNIMSVWTASLLAGLVLGCAGGLIPRQIGL